MDGDDRTAMGEGYVQDFGLQGYMIDIEALAQKILHDGQEPAPVIEVVHYHMCRQCHGPR